MNARRRSQKMIAVTMSHNTMLSSDEKRAATSQLPLAQLEQLNCRISGEHKVLVSFYKHKYDDKSTTNNHSIREDWNCCRRKNSAQIDPTSNWRCEFANTLWIEFDRKSAKCHKREIVCDDGVCCMVFEFICSNVLRRLLFSYFRCYYSMYTNCTYVGWIVWVCQQANHTTEETSQSVSVMSWKKMRKKNFSKAICAKEKHSKSFVCTSPSPSTMTMKIF